MRAETAEIRRDDVGRLLLPMVHVERNIARQTLIVSVEFPEEEMRRCQTRHEWRRRVYHHLTDLAVVLVNAWQPPDQEQP